MLTDNMSNQVPPNKVLIPRNPKHFNITRPLNNVVIKSPPSPTPLINSSNQKLFLLKVTDNKKQPHYIRLPSLNAIKLVGDQTNVDLKLEQIPAPTHVLDHSYATNQNLIINSLNIRGQTKPNENSVCIIQNVQQNCKTLNTGLSSPQIRSKVTKKVGAEKKTKPIFIKPVNSEVVHKITPLPAPTIITTTTATTQPSQTPEKLLIAELKKQLNAKKVENQMLQKNLKRLQKESKTIVKKRLQDVLKNIFSPAQIEKLLNPHKAKVKWTVEDIISALTLQNVSLKAYTYLRDNNYPLPGLSTIRKWTAQINLNEGLLKDVLVIMKFRTKSLSFFQKIVILHFDELCISNESCLICVASGLFYKWMQPVYFCRKKTLSFVIIAEIVSQLFSAGFTVVALTSNLESKHIWNQLNIGIGTGEKCYILHPSKMNYKIYIFPDECHLLTLIRKEFLENGFVVNDKRVNKHCVEKLTTICKKQETVKFCKLLGDSLNDSGNKCDNSTAALAKQLFSKEIADKIFSNGRGGYISHDGWKETANFFDMTSKWIKLFNAKSIEYYNAGEEPYGLELERQNKTLDEVKKLMGSVKIDGVAISPTVQEQVVLWINSLQELLPFLQETFSIETFPIKYILTHKLSSQCLSNVIGYLTSSDGANSKPQDISGVTLTKFQTKLRKCILGKYLTDSISGHVWKILDPCLIDFNEKSEPAASVNSSGQKETDSNVKVEGEEEEEENL